MTLFLSFPIAAGSPALHGPHALHHDKPMPPQRAFPLSLLQAARDASRGLVPSRRIQMPLSLAKRAQFKLFGWFLLFLLFTLPAHAQNTSAPVDAPTIELKKNPIDVLRELEPAADAPYQLGIGDEITVEVAGRSELSSKHTVGPDGRITLPVAGSVEVADNTREQAAALIENALGSYYQGVTVFVSVDKYTSNRITLLGAVGHPGVMNFEGAPLLLEVISRGGPPVREGVAPVPGDPIAAYPEECIIYRGKDTVFTVELRQLIEEDHNLADYRLRRNDIVYVPGPTKYVSVMGMVIHPGTLNLTNRSTLPQLLAEAGGPTEKAGNSAVIQVIHRGDAHAPSRVITVRYKDILQAKPLDLTLYSGDILYVPESGLNKIGYVLEKLAPLATLVTLGAIMN